MNPTDVYDAMPEHVQRERARRQRLAAVRDAVVAWLQRQQDPRAAYHIDAIAAGVLVSGWSTGELRRALTSIAHQYDATFQVHEGTQRIALHPTLAGPDPRVRVRQRAARRLAERLQRQGWRPC